MESTSFFEKKISLTPSDFNKVKNTSIDELLTIKSKEAVENKCSEQGFVLPGSVKLLSHSMGYFEAARFTGDAVYYVKLEGKIIYPADGVRVTGEVIRKNKMGLYVDYKNAIRIQVPRDLHIGNQEYDSVEIGDTVEIELKRSKFQINDPYIIASGVFVMKHGGINATNGTVNVPKSPQVEDEDSEDEADDEENQGLESEGEEDDGLESEAEEDEEEQEDQGESEVEDEGEEEEEEQVSEAEEA